MPKNKRQLESSESESSSDSGPEDKTPVKKSKPESSSAKKSKKEAAEDGWALDKYKFVKVREFKGKTFVDIREFYLDKNSGDLKPGKKGIALQLAQWEKLKEIIPEVDEAMKDH